MKRNLECFHKPLGLNAISPFFAFQSMTVLCVCRVSIYKFDSSGSTADLSNNCSFFDKSMKLGEDTHFDVMKKIHCKSCNHPVISRKRI